MSAHMCDATHISAVADILVALGKETYSGLTLDPEEDATTLFHVLLTENAMSLESRYPSNWTEMLPGRSLSGMAYSYQTDGADLARYPQPADSLANALKALNCYAYQSCEHKGWQESRAFHLVNQAEGILGKRLAKLHPAYNEAEWGWAARPKRARKVA